ncbi:hypothetical protein ACVZJW_05355 [Citrobacter portucalensis]
MIDTGKNTLGYRIEVDSAAFSDVGHVLKEVTVHVSVTSHDAAGNAIATSSHDVHSITSRKTRRRERQCGQRH